jgi:hypothetical protein
MVALQLAQVMSDTSAQLDRILRKNLGRMA